MKNPYRPLTLRCNRFLGRELVSRGLVSATDLDEANGKLLESLEQGFIRTSLLNILITETEKLDESSLIDYLVKEENLSLINLNHIPVRHLETRDLDSEVCFATWTFPFDRIGEYTQVATNFYLSEPCRMYWEELIEGPILWYVTSVHSMANALGRLIETAEESTPGEGTSP